MWLELPQSANFVIFMAATMQIGLLKLESNLFLSPLAGYTNLPFRLVVREIGGVGLCTTDLVNARSLLEKRAKAFKLIETRPADSPLAVQLFGSVPEEMRDAALMLEARGVAALDINMGCPVRKVCNVGGGSAMMTQLNRTAALVRGMAGAVSIPVTAKMRLGWDDQNITAPDLARALEDAGVAAIFVHGRTREQGFGGVVNLDGIRQVVRAVKAIPVIGNGDITTPLAARKMLDETGCAGVSIGRGAFYNPWIFRHTLDYLQSTQGRAGSPFHEPGEHRTTNIERRTSNEREPTPHPDPLPSHPRLYPHPVPLPSEWAREKEREQSAGATGDSGDWQLATGSGVQCAILSGKSLPAIGPGASDAAQENLPPEPPFTERVRVMCRHLDLMIEVFGEEGGCRMFRKVAPWYARRFGPCHEFNKRAVQISTRAEFQDVLANYICWRRQFTDERGELLPRFRPPPLVASFMRDQPASTQRQSIPVPKGPVEVW